MAFQQVDIPEKRGGISGLINMFTQGAGMLQTGMKGKEAIAGLMGSGAGGGGGGAAGAAGAGGAYSLGVGNVKPVTDGMSSSLPATEGSSGVAAGGGESAGALAGGVAVGAGAAIAEAKYQKDVREGKVKDEGTGHYAIGQSANYNDLRDRVISGHKDPLGATRTNLKNTGLGLTSYDQMGAIERRYRSNDTAMQDIEAARAALNEAGLSIEDRRSIASKLEKARSKQTGRV